MIERKGPTHWLARCRALPGNVRGALWMFLAAIMYSASEALIKTVGQTIDSFQIVFFRCALGILIVSPFLIPAGLGAIRTKKLGGHLLRSSAGYVASATAFYALTHLPLADATALSFARPLFVVILAVLFLGETVRWRRWTATACGFAGVLVMARPDGAAVEFATLVALVSAFFVAVVSVAIKRLAETERPVTIMFYFTTVSSVLSLGPALYVWRTPTVTELALLLLMGAVGSTGQYFTIRSFRIAEATAVDPIDYTRLILATLIGIAFFSEVPDIWTLVGAAIIVGSTLYIARREARLGHKRAAGPATPVRL